MISFKCPGCQAPFNVPDDKAGKSGKCPKCLTPFRVPGGSLAPPPSASPPPPPRPRPTPAVADEPPVKMAGDEESPRRQAARRDETEDLRDDEPDADERPKAKPRRAEPEDEADERPRKKARDRRDDDEADEERPRKKPDRKTAAGRDGDADDDRPRRKSGGRAVVAVRSSLDGALKMLRRSQFLDIAAVAALLLVAAVLYFFVVGAAESQAAKFAAAQEEASEKYNDDWRKWQLDRGRNGQWTPPPVRPPILWEYPPSPREAVYRTLADNVLYRALPALPALVLIAAGVLSTVGRIQLAAAGSGSGGGRAFAATAALAIGRLLLGLALVGLIVWYVLDADALSRRGDGLQPLLALGGVFVLALYVGVLGEVFALPGLALIGWHAGTDGRQRHRIGTAAAFYPVAVVAWFVLSLVFGALGYFVPDLLVAVAALQALLFLTLQVLQYLVVSRAYRLPLTETAQT